MKMFYNGTPVESMKIKHYEMNTNDATLIPSDLQTGVTAYARGKKITGTGKCFEFANYGLLTSNKPRYVPNDINIIEIGSSEYAIKLTMPITSMSSVDFSTEQNIATVIVDGVEHTISVSVVSNIMTLICNETIQLQVFYGKDNYV